MPAIAKPASSQPPPNVLKVAERTPLVRQRCSPRAPTPHPGTHSCIPSVPTKNSSLLMIKGPEDPPESSEDEDEPIDRDPVDPDWMLRREPSCAVPRAQADSVDDVLFFHFDNAWGRFIKYASVSTNKFLRVLGDLCSLASPILHNTAARKKVHSLLHAIEERLDVPAHQRAAEYAHAYLHNAARQKLRAAGVPDELVVEFDTRFATLDLGFRSRFIDQIVFSRRAGAMVRWLPLDFATLHLWVSALSADPSACSPAMLALIQEAVAAVKWVSEGEHPCLPDWMMGIRLPGPGSQGLVTRLHGLDLAQLSIHAIIDVFLELQSVPSDLQHANHHIGSKHGPSLWEAYAWMVAMRTRASVARFLAERKHLIYQQLSLRKRPVAVDGTSHPPVNPPPTVGIKRPRYADHPAGPKNEPFYLP